MEINIQLLTLSATLVLSVTFVGVGCQGDSDRTDASRSDARTASTSYQRESLRTNAVARTDADNTRVNVRDRDDATLTPGDQGTTAADRDITQQIRKSLVSTDNSYSLAAQNVKIITVNGKVTLRGPVNTDTEKSGIVSVAKKVAGQDNVEDQLEVKANP
jgi:hyperosmotically inducible protein